jgi:DNA repair photolyase
VARGAADNPANRFERIHLEETEEALLDCGELSAEEDAPPLQSRFYRDPSRTLLSTNDSPDIPFDTSLNPYRGCEHGCAYCFARPTHEYLGFSAGLDFETRVLVKSDAPALLRERRGSKRWKPQAVALSGVTDAYQPAERKLRLTRRCLEVFAEFRNPVGIVTKSALVARDIDILGEMAEWNGAMVHVSLTSLNDDLRRALEPRTASPRHRLETIARLAEAGIPVGAMIAPIIPGLNDAEIPALVAAAADAGARSASTIMLRLPHGLAPLFEDWLDRHAPERKQKVMNGVRAMRGGKHYDATYHTRMRGTGLFAEQTRALFQLACRRAGLSNERIALSTEHFRSPRNAQLSLL